MWSFPGLVIHGTVPSHGMLGVVLRQLLALCGVLPYYARMGHRLGDQAFSTSNRYFRTSRRNRDKVFRQLLCCLEFFSGLNV